MCSYTLHCFQSSFILLLCRATKRNKLIPVNCYMFPVYCSFFVMSDFIVSLCFALCQENPFGDH